MKYDLILKRNVYIITSKDEVFARCFYIDINANIDNKRKVHTVYCISCGVQIPDNSVFCPSCGKKQTSSGLQSDGRDKLGEENSLKKTEINNDTVASIQKLLEPLNQIRLLNEKLDKYEHNIEYYKRKNRRPFSSAIITFAISFIIISILFGQILLDLRDISLILSFVFIFIFIPVIICFGITYGNKKRYESAIASYDSCLDEIDTICERLDPEEVELLPPSYRFYDAANFFYNSFINQRAYTMQEAVNLYESELQSNKAAQIQMDQQNILRKISESTERSAQTNTVSAFANSVTAVNSHKIYKGLKRLYGKKTFK